LAYAKTRIEKIGKMGPGHDQGEIDSVVKSYLEKEKMVQNLKGKDALRVISLNNKILKNGLYDPEMFEELDWRIIAKAEASVYKKVMASDFNVHEWQNFWDSSEGLPLKNLVFTKSDWWFYFKTKNYYELSRYATDVPKP
jgi:hypothetical protein